MIRTYERLMQFETFLERYRYLQLDGKPGNITWGAERYINQRFYRSKEWRDLRNYIITRDNGCDLAAEGYEIYAKLLIHHMNPMQIGDSISQSLNPRYLITTTHRTHNAIHYGDDSLILKPFVVRSPGDTKLW